MNTVKEKLNYIDKQTTVKKKQIVINKTDDEYIKNELILRSKYIGINDFFPTPYSVCEIIRDQIPLEWKPNGDYKILEPSAGTGNICDCLLELFPNWKKEIFDCCEINDDFVCLLKSKGYNVIGNDCIDISGSYYNAVIMNPPFKLWKEHLLHCLSLLKDQGILVCILPNSVLKYEDMLENLNAEWFKFDGDEFKYSGANVQNIMLIIRK